MTYRLVHREGSTTSTPVLDRIQSSVVAHHGPLLVLGGPGSGKTTTLLACVAARITAGTPPDQVLVWAFQRKASSNLLDGIAAHIGRTTAEPLVRTPHGYAFAVLRLAAARRGDLPPKLITGPEQDLVIRELLRGAILDGRDEWPASLRPALLTRGFASELRDLLLRVVERGVSPAQLAQWGRLHERPDWMAAAAFLDEYVDVRLLRDPNGYDPAELIRSAIAELRDDPALLAAERARLSHVYVDDAQDLDPAQRELLRLVTDRAIGFADPDSTTFTFRGADPAGLREFAPDSIMLPGCWRTGGRLLTATRRVAARLRGPGRQLTQDREHGGHGPDGAHRPETHRPGGVPGPAGDQGPAGDYEVALLPSASQEASLIAHRLRAAHLLDGVAWSRMAVIVRSTAATLGPLRRALSMAGVPVATAAADLPLPAQPAVRTLLTLLDCAVHPAKLDEDTAAALLRSPLGGADPLSERRLRQGHAPERPVNLADLIADPPEEPWALPARRLADLLAVARRALAGADGAEPGTVVDVLWAVWGASGLAERWERDALAGGESGAAADRDLDAVVALFEVAGRFTDRLPGAGPHLFLDHVLGQDLPGDSLAPTADRGAAVQVVTAHSAKGLEWDVVAVAGVQEGLWPNVRPRGSLLGSELLVDIAADVPPLGVASLLEEERRLFYVAVTRARKMLIVTAVASTEESPSRFIDELRSNPQWSERALVEYTPSPRSLTLSGIVAELRGKLPDIDSARQLAALAAAGVPGAHPDEWWGLPAVSDHRPLALDGERVRVSPSTLDTVLNCGLRWLLGRHGAEIPSVAGSIGTLVHFAAELSASDGITRAEIFDEVRRRFARIDSGVRWYGEHQWRDVEAMVDRLLRWADDRRGRVIAVERGFRVDFGAGVELVGRVDRLERDDDGRLVVIDFKTGHGPEDAETSKQLAAYQAAVEAGAFPEGDSSGGAALVRLRLKGDAERWQPPISAAEDPDWGADLVRRAGAAMSGATVLAIEGSHCRGCPVKLCCPVYATEVTA